MKGNPELIDKAIKLCGGTQKLFAAKIGRTQQFVSLLANGSTISAEVAIEIERATEGKISRRRLRPDLFGSLAAPNQPRVSG